MVVQTVFAIGLIFGQASKVVNKPSDPAPVGLPAAWHGVWKGRCQTESAAGARQEFSMELHIAPLESGKVRWQIVYGEGAKRQVRPYELIPDPKVSGRFVIDEKNGILLDCQLFGNVLVCQFLVEGNLISTREELTTEGIRVELTTFDHAKPRHSAAGTFSVQSFPLKAIQRGLLRRTSTTAKGI